MGAAKWDVAMNVPEDEAAWNALENLLIGFDWDEDLSDKVDGWEEVVDELEGWNEVGDLDKIELMT